MDFIIDPESTFEWPIKVRVPKGGSFEEQTFTGRFRMVPEQELFRDPIALDDEVAPKTAAELIEEEKTLILKVWIGWAGELKMRDGSVAMEDDATMEAMLSMRHVRLALSEAINDAFRPDGARAKN
ncbi:MAG: hypothetical protein AAF618_00075 [Pseudomonadota bacterium]